MWTDSSAAIGICTRQGLGKLRHLDTHTLWIQQAVRTRRVDLRKVDGEANPADLLTKHSISRQRLEGLVTLFSCKYLEGRAASAPLVRKGGSNRHTMAEADRDLSEVCEEAARDGGQEEETSPTMPHLTCTDDELDEQYPPLAAPEDDNLDDLHDDSGDGVYQHGLAIAADIRVQTAAEGRKRRPATVEPGGEEEVNGKFNDEAQEESFKKALATLKAARRTSRRMALTDTQQHLSAEQRLVAASEEECLVLLPLELLVRER